MPIIVKTVRNEGGDRASQYTGASRPVQFYVLNAFTGSIPQSKYNSYPTASGRFRSYCKGVLGEQIPVGNFRKVMTLGLNLQFVANCDEIVIVPRIEIVYSALESDNKLFLLSGNLSWRHKAFLRACFFACAWQCTFS
jgi:hypothetical protein